MKFDNKTLLIGGVLVVGALVVFKRDWVCTALHQLPVDLPLGNFCLEHSKNVIRETCAEFPDSKYCQEHPEFTKVPWGGGTQETKAGTRYLAGPDDLPAANYAGYY